MDVKTTFRNLVRDQSVSICMLQSLLRFCHRAAGGAAAASGVTAAGSAADAAPVIFALWILSLNCTGPGRSGAEAGSHDGTDGTGNATSARLLRPHQMWSVIKRGRVGAEDLPTD